MRALVWLVLGTVAACKTGGTDAPPPILSEPSLSEPRAAPPPVRPVVESLPPPPPPQLPVLAEPLMPVRGGAKVLPPYLGPDPCKMALTGESPVAKACSSGGERQALELMQLFVKRARAAGFNFVCANCHVDEDDRSRLAPTADAEFRKLLFLAQPDD